MLNIKTTNWEPAPSFCARREECWYFHIACLVKDVCADVPCCHWNKLFVTHEPWGHSTQSTEQQGVHLGCRAHTAAPEPGTNVARQHSTECAAAAQIQIRSKKKKMCLPWNSVLTSHFISNNFSSFSCRTEKYGGVPFTGVRRRDTEEVKKATNQQNDDSSLGEKEEG